MTAAEADATPLAAAHDALLLDLDGTLMLAATPIDHAADVVSRASGAGLRTLVVTNNASRTPADTAAYLDEGGFNFTAGDIINSPMAAAELLAQRHRPGDAVLIVGADALAQAIAVVGLRPVRTADDHPVAVVQGHSPDTGWRDLAEACVALAAGAEWVATNTDATLPTDRGQLPGNGAMVQALATASGREPIVTGKPGPALLETAVRRAGAQRPLVVGDRLETDIDAAIAAGMPSLMVLTGVSTIDDILALPPESRPTYLGTDMRAIFDPARCVALAGLEETAVRSATAAWPGSPAR